MSEEPNTVRPLVATDRGPMAAMVVGAIDQQPAHAHLAHFVEGDFLASASLHYAQTATGLHPFQRRDQFRPFEHRHKLMNRTNGAAQRARFEVLGQNTLGLFTAPSWSYASIAAACAGPHH